MPFGTGLNTVSVYDGNVVYTGTATTWYLLVNGAPPAAPRASGFDGGAASPANQSIGGDGTANGTFPGLITEARVSTIARYPASAYPTPTPPLATDYATLAS